MIVTSPIDTIGSWTRAQIEMISRGWWVLLTTGSSASWLPDARAVVLDAGHFLWEEVPEQYASAILGAVV